VDRSAKEHSTRTNHQGYDWLFEPLKVVLDAADWGFANLETPIASRAYYPRDTFIFNGKSALLDGLAEAGFNILNFANNHSFDQGLKGAAETIAEATKRELILIGIGADKRTSARGILLKSGRMTIGIIGFSEFMNGHGLPRTDAMSLQPRVNAIHPIAELTAAVKSLKSQADAVIVSLHWGSEYQISPREDQLKLARLIVDSGVDVILGHHPHVLQPIEIHRAPDGHTGLIAYSLGNLIANQNRFYELNSRQVSSDCRDGILLKFTLRKTGRTTSLADVGYYPLWIENRDTANGVELRPVLSDLELARLTIQLEEAPMRRASITREKIIQIDSLLKRRKLLEFRKQRVIDRVGSKFYQNISSPHLRAVIE
jgi:poly-gamma-glutamate synthesis protein (capsule biosynthesis protein)